MGRQSRTAHRALITALRAKDPSATVAVYDRYAHALYGYACGFVGASQASDIVHDAMWIASRRIAALRDPDLFEPWLHAIVRAECVRVLQATRQPVEYRPATGESPYPDAALPGAGLREAALQETAGFEDVRAAVAGLDPVQREAFDLAARRRFTAAEVDAVLGSAGDDRVLPQAQDAVARAVPWLPDASGLFARLPSPPLPGRLRDRVFAARPSDDELTGMGRRIDPLDRNGFPVAGRPRRALAAAAASGGVVVLVAVALLVWPDHAPADQPTSKPAGGSAQLQLGSAPTSAAATGTSTSGVTSTPASTSPTSPTSTTSTAPAIADATDPEAPPAEATTDATTTPETASSSTPPRVTETRWSSRRDSSDDRDDDREEGPTEKTTTSRQSPPPATNPTSVPSATRFPGIPHGGR